MTTPSMLPAAEVPREPIHRLTVAQYRAMASAGILVPGDRVELLEGWLVEKMTKNPPHRIATRHVRVALERLVPTGFYVDTQEPITTADSEPEPDVAVIRGRTEDYADRNPGAEHVALVIEIADATLTRDRELKQRVYARAGIPSYWIVNLVNRSVEVHTKPSSGAQPHASYAERTVHMPGELLALRLDDVEVGRVAIDDLLP
jgi:Uma2 family endonuclease